MARELHVDTAVLVKLHAVRMAQGKIVPTGRVERLVDVESADHPGAAAERVVCTEGDTRTEGLDIAAFGITDLHIPIKNRGRKPDER